MRTPWGLTSQESSPQESRIPIDVSNLDRIDVNTKEAWRLSDTDRKLAKICAWVFATDSEESQRSGQEIVGGINIHRISQHRLEVEFRSIDRGKSVTNFLYYPKYLINKDIDSVGDMPMLTENRWVVLKRAGKMGVYRYETVKPTVDKTFSEILKEKDSEFVAQITKH